MSNQGNLPAIFKQPDVFRAVTIPQSKGSNVPMYMLVLALAAMVGLSFVFHLEQFVKTQGAVVPSDKVVTVQHLYGGTVIEVYKKEGDLVKAGEPLYKVDLSVNSMDLAGLELRMAGFQLSRQRRLAEVNDTPLKFTEEQTQAHPDLTSAEMAAYLSRKSELREAAGINLAQGMQADSRLSELQSQIRRLERDLTTAKRATEIKKGLFDGGHIGEMEYLDSVRNMNRVEGDLEVAKKSIHGVSASKHEVLAKSKDAKAIYVADSAEALATLDKNISALRSEIEKARKQAEGTLVVAPADGILSSVMISGPSAVIRPADKIAEIIPQEGGMLIEALMKASDRGLVKEGMPVNIKIDSYDYLRYGTLEGIVERISANSTPQPNGLHSFKVWVRPSKTYLGHAEGIYPISVGMSAQVDIHVQDQTVFDYVVNPVLRVTSESFTEPNK